MKLITLATIALTLLAPVTHATESNAELLQELEDNYKATLQAAHKQDASLARLVCERRPEEINCDAQVLQLLEQYKHNVVKFHQLIARYHEARDKL